MANFAVINKKTNEVLTVIVIDNDRLMVKGSENEQKGVVLCEQLFKDGYKGVDFENLIFRQTSYNKTKRYNYAGIGHKWDEVAGAFYAPKPKDKQGGEYVLDEKYRWKFVSTEANKRLRGKSKENLFTKIVSKENWFTKLVKVIKNFLNKIFK